MQDLAGRYRKHRKCPRQIYSFEIYNMIAVSPVTDGLESHQAACFLKNRWSWNHTSQFTEDIWSYNQTGQILSKDKVKILRSCIPGIYLLRGKAPEIIQGGMLFGGWLVGASTRNCKFNYSCQGGSRDPPGSSKANSGTPETRKQTLFGRQCGGGWGGARVGVKTHMYMDTQT